MAKNRINFIDFEETNTLIGEGVYVEGTLKTDHNIQINGIFKGTLETAAEVVIGEKAEVKANIEAQNVYVAGQVQGDVTATEKLEILETGRIFGNVKSASLVIEPGGILKGKSEMLPTEKEKPELKPTYEVETGEEES